MIFTLFLLVCMVMIGGMAVDAIRHETKRSHLQSVLDRGVLAAADLEQTLDPTVVVTSYLTTAGLDPTAHNLSVTPSTGLNFKQVSATASYSVPTIFMNIVGVTQLPVNTASSATEQIMDVEISLVLDVSGSMNSSNRLNLLKTAANQFVDAVLPAGNPANTKHVSVSVVPFATQVNAGPELLRYYNASSEHAYSDCVDFTTAHFSTTRLRRTEPLQRTGHFDPWGSSRTPSDSRRVCHPASHRYILPWADNPTTVKAAITALSAGGNTSIDIGTKWGTALLDRSARGVLRRKANANTVHDDFRGRPYNYNTPNTMKVLVVMSDGQNTSQYYLNPAAQSGQSEAYLDPQNNGTSDDRWSMRESNNNFYRERTDSFHSTPDGGSSAARQSYAELWNSMSIRWWADNLKSPATGNTSWSHRSWAYSTHGGSTKNTRTSSICTAAKNRGILVFTIGMDTYGQGDATLLDCASSPAHFFDVSGVEISVAFAAIASQINQLKLTQ